MNLEYSLGSLYGGKREVLGLAAHLDPHTVALNPSATSALDLVAQIQRFIVDQHRRFREPIVNALQLKIWEWPGTRGRDGGGDIRCRRRIR